MKLTIASLILYKKNQNATNINFKFILEHIPMVLLLVFPFVIAIKLHLTREYLNTRIVKDRIGAMYTDIHLTRNKYTILYYPIFLIRRLYFVLIPVILFDDTCY